MKKLLSHPVAKTIFVMLLIMWIVSLFAIGSFTSAQFAICMLEGIGLIAYEILVFGSEV